MSTELSSGFVVSTSIAALVCTCLLLLLSLFVVVGLFGIYHKVRQEQDYQILIYLCISVILASTTSSAYLFLNLSQLSSWCVSVPKFIIITRMLAKLFQYFFVVRKASLVQLAGSFGIPTFVVLMILGVGFILSNVVVATKNDLVEGMSLTSSAQYFCVMEINYGLIVFNSVFDILINGITLYWFTQPLLEHLRISADLASQRNALQQRSTRSPQMIQIDAISSIHLQHVVSRNVKSFIISSISSVILAVVLGILQIVSTSTNVNVAIVAYLCIPYDLLISSWSLMYVCSNAWEFPASAIRLDGTIRGSSISSEVKGVEAQVQISQVQQQQQRRPLHVVSSRSFGTLELAMDADNISNRRQSQPELKTQADYF